MRRGGGGGRKEGRRGGGGDQLGFGVLFVEKLVHSALHCKGEVIIKQTTAILEPS